MKTLLLVRHGQSHWNLERRIQGQDGTGLTPTGHAQVRATAEVVAAEFPDALVVTSDLVRCRETVAPLEALLGITADLEPGLRERHFGRWQGRLVAEVAGEEPDRFARWGIGEDVVPEVGGESGPELATRVVEVVRRRLDEVAHGGTLVCVTHGGPVHHGTQTLLGLPVGAIGGVANGSIARFGFEGERVWLDGWNQTTHQALHLRTTSGATQDTKPSSEDPRGPDAAPPPVGA